MSDYSKTVDFEAKDALAEDDPNKIAKGTEVDDEFDAIATAVATKANKVGSATNNNLLTMDASGDLKDSTIVTNGSGTITATAFVGPLTGNVTGDATGNVTGNAGTATAWETTRTITMTGDVTADAVNIDGTGNIDITNSVMANKLTILDTPVSLVSDTTTTATTQTAVDITAQTTGVAVKAIIRVSLEYATGGTGRCEVLVGEGDETLTAVTHRAAGNDSINMSDMCETSVHTVNLASGEIFDYAILQAGNPPASRTVSIYLIGYYV